MNFLIVNTEYDLFLRSLYNAHPGLENRPYNEQLNIRFDSLFGMNNFRSKNLLKIGHEAREVFFNNKVVQEKWLKEFKPAFEIETQNLLKNLEAANVSTDYKILALQISYYKPDVLLLDAMDAIDSEFIKAFKPFVKLILGCGEPPVLLQNRDYSDYDIVLGASPLVVDTFNSKGIYSDLLYFGFEKTVLDKINTVPVKHDIVFAGGITEHHSSRVKFLDYLLDRFPIEIYAPENSFIQNTPKFKNNFKGTVFGKDMYELFASSKIVLNNHIDIAKNYADNMRLFESTGVSTLLITDNKKNLSELFNVGKEIEDYSSPEECAEKIEYYLKNENERKDIAANGQARTITNHTYEIRANELINVIEKYNHKSKSFLAVKPKEIEIIADQDLKNVHEIATAKRFGDYLVNYGGIKIFCQDLLSFYMAFKDIFLQKIYNFETDKPNPVIIDGGGHIGLATLYFKYKYPNSKVIIFEPDELSLTLLRKNLAANNIQNVEIIEAGLFNEEKTLTFHPDSSDGSTIFSEGEGISIDVVPLSKYINEEIDFVKLNIEGTELEVISELGDKLTKVKELVIEYHGFPNIGQRLHNILSIFDSYGFRYMIHDFDNETNAASKPPFYLDEKKRFFNLIYAKKLWNKKENVNSEISEIKIDNKREPVSRLFGFDRGKPIDRFYIEKFIKENSSLIKGTVLEIGDDSYTKAFGKKVTKSEILNYEPSPACTIVGDLSTGKNIPAQTFDCIILTQTLQFIYDAKTAIQNAYKALKPGGTILLTASGISQISRYDMDRWGEFWRFTNASLQKLMEENTDNAQIVVTSFGNVEIAKAFLDGLSCEEIPAELFDYNDKDYQVLLTAAVRKPDNTSIYLKDSADEIEPTVLIYHRVADDPIDSQLLAVSPKNFEQQIKLLSEDYKVISLREMLNDFSKNQLRKNTVAITFDDGYADNFYNALPILEKHKAHAAIFVSTGFVGNNREFWWDDMERIFFTKKSIPHVLSINDETQSLNFDLSNYEKRIDTYDKLHGFLKKNKHSERQVLIDELLNWVNLPLSGRETNRVMTEVELNEISKSKFIELGAHSVWHDSLAVLNSAEQANEIKHSIQTLSNMLGKKVELFSYPYGSKNDINEETLQILRQLGFKNAIANIQGEINNQTNPYLIPRRLVRNWSKEEFGNWLSGNSKHELEHFTVAKRKENIINYLSQLQ